MTIRTVIADDEPLARERLDALLRADPDFQIVQHCRNGREVVQVLADQPVDLLLLDIRMPGLDGFDAIRESRMRKLPMIVFVTAYDRFAVDAFGVHAVDYLLKPIELARFREAMAAVKKRARMEKALESRARYPERLMVRSGSKELFLTVKEIAWIEAADYYACLHVAEKQYLLRETIKSLETKLDPKQFVRIHRSAIVNVGFVREIHRQGRTDGWVLLANGERPRMTAAGWRKLTASFTASR
jgi:two-component system LytT family response regulator